jgi:hypothetical protein
MTLIRLLAMILLGLGLVWISISVWFVSIFYHRDDEVS